MRSKNNKTKRAVCITLFGVLALFLVLYELLLKSILFGELGEWERSMTDMLITRSVGGGIFLVFTVYLGYRVLYPITRPIGKNILYILPALVIAVNNLPIIPLVLGKSEIVAG